ncbi:MAG: AAA family ATPase [Acidobacteriota bacterium]
MKVIALVNIKGGVGKTTLAVTLAGELSTAGRTVQLIDADPQESATSWAAQRESGALPVLPLESQEPADLASAIRSSRAERVIVDCPGRLATIAEAALLLADLALVPVKPSPVDLWEVDAVLETLELIRAARGSELPAVALVPSQGVVGTVLARDLPEVLAGYGVPVAPAVAARMPFAEAAARGETIGEYAPGSKAHQEAQALARFAEELTA